MTTELTSKPPRSMPHMWSRAQQREQELQELQRQLKVVREDNNRLRNELITYLSMSITTFEAYCWDCGAERVRLAELLREAGLNE